MICVRLAYCTCVQKYSRALAAALLLCTTLFSALHVAISAACLIPGCKHYPQHVDCRFQIEHLSAEHESQQSGAEGSSGFSSAQAIQEAIHAGATCIGRTNTPEIALGYVIAHLQLGQCVTAYLPSGTTCSPIFLITTFMQGGEAIQQPEAVDIGLDLQADRL